MTVCYLVQTYKNPQQIYRLVKLIEKTTTDSLIIVSHNFNSCNLDVELLRKLKNVEVIPNNGVMMGSFAIIQGLFDAIRWLLSQKIKFDWLVNISGQDYPTKPLSKIESFLEKTEYDGFVEHFDVFSRESPWNRKIVNTRYYYHYRHFQQYLSPWQKFMLKPIKHVVNNSQPLIRLDSSYGVTVGIRKFGSLFSKDFICYGGSYFTTLSKPCVTYLYDFFKDNPKVINYYKSTFIPEESLIQTVLVNSHKFNLCNSNYRYTDFSNSRHGHPRILTDQDFSQLTRANVHFARKFDIKSDSQILDKLDKVICTSLKKDIPRNEMVNKQSQQVRLQSSC